MGTIRDKTRYCLHQSFTFAVRPGAPFKQNRELNGSSNDVSGSALISLAIPTNWGVREGSGCQA